MVWELMQQFPLLLPCKNTETAYKGFITIVDEDYPCNLTVPNFPLAAGFQLQSNWHLQQLMEKHQPQLREILQGHNVTVLTVLKYIQNILEKEFSGKQSTGSLRTIYFSTIMKDIEQIGWSHVKHIDEHFTQLTLEAIDSKQRQHLLQLTVTENYPIGLLSSAPKSLPTNYGNWIQIHSLVLIYETFCKELVRYQELWDILDHLDSIVWILEPENPQRCDCYRRIALGNNMSILVVLDPLKPSEKPTMQFVGAECQVKPLKETLNKNLELNIWDNKGDILQNLEKVLETQFPTVQTATKAQVVVECGICYLSLYNGLLPNCECDDHRCLHVYHEACLYIWLNSLKTKQERFRRIHGECPYCHSNISCKIVSK